MRWLILFWCSILFAQGTSTHGSSLKFDGSSGYINLGQPTEMQIDSAVTVCGWVKIDSFTNTNQELGLFGDGRHTGASADRGGWFVGGYQEKIWFVIGDQTTANGIVAADSLREDTWYFICCMWDGTKDANGISLFYNGNWEYTTATADSLRTDKSFYVAVRDPVTKYSFINTKHIMVFANVTLDSAVVEWMYRHPGQVYDDTDLVGWWTFSEFTGTTVGDSSSSSNDATVSGTATWSIETPRIAGGE